MEQQFRVAACIFIEAFHSVRPHFVFFTVSNSALSDGFKTRFRADRRRLTACIFMEALTWLYLDGFATRFRQTGGGLPLVSLWKPQLGFISTDLCNTFPCRPAAAYRLYFVEASNSAFDGFVQHVSVQTGGGLPLVSLWKP